MSKTIAVIGAGPGIGRAVAERFGREGYKVALLSRDAESLGKLAASLQAKGVEAASFPADVCDRPGLTAALGKVITQFGSIDVLEYGPTPGPETLRSPKYIDVENQQLHLDIALLGAIAAVRVVLPGMLARKEGALLFTSAASAQYPTTFTASFGVAAGAALNYARVLNQELAGDGIYSGFLAVTGFVVEKGKENIPHPTGLPVMTAEYVADLHWDMYTKRDRVEDFAGDIQAVLKPHAEMGEIWMKSVSEQ